MSLTLPDLAKIPLVAPKGNEVLACGYRLRDLERIMDAVEFEEFSRWLIGQTCTIDEESNIIVYAWDVKNWMKPSSRRFWD